MTVTIVHVVWLLLMLGGTNGAQWRGISAPPLGVAKSVCKHTDVCSFYSDVLLVIKLNPVRILWVDLLLNFYGTGFPHIVFFSALRHGDPVLYRPITVGSRNTTVHLVEDNYGFCDHEVVAAASAWFPEYSGYLFLSDDVLFAFWKVIELSKDAIWRQPSKNRGIEEMTDSERRAVRDLASELPSVRAAFPAPARSFPFAPTSGIYFVPQSAAAAFRDVSAVLYRHRTYNEWGTPIVLAAAAAASGVRTLFIPGKLQWGKKRFFALKLMHRDRIWYHPVRASGETFLRLTLWIHRVREPMVAKTTFSVIDLYSDACLECATHPVNQFVKKGLYHSCREAPPHRQEMCPQVARSAHEVGTYTAVVVERSHLEGVPATQFVGGRVFVPRGWRGLQNPFELAHEGFWGREVTTEVYNSWLPSVNATVRKETLPFTLPFPQCCVSRV